VAALIGNVLGRPIDAAKVQLDTSTALPANSPEGRQLTAMKPMFDWYDRHSLLGNARSRCAQSSAANHEPYERTSKNLPAPPDAVAECPQSRKGHAD
jgi:hypothetical protein